METLKRKLSSRKLWAAIVTLLLSAAVIFLQDELSADVIDALKCAAAAAIAYIFGESAVDIGRN